MTIIQPKKSKTSFFNPFMIVALVTVVGFAALNTVVYTHAVNLQHAILVQQKTLDETRAGNAELKNAFYQLLDENNLQTLVEQRGFIKITNPNYLSSL